MSQWGLHSRANEGGMRPDRRTLIAGLAAVGVASRALAAPNSINARPINDVGYVSIGGIDQWVAIQGADRSNPVILYLHGGPGEAQSPFLDMFKPWLRDFTVVNWDQREVRA